MQKSIRRGLACLVALAVCTGGVALASSHTEKKPAERGGQLTKTMEMELTKQ